MIELKLRLQEGNTERTVTVNQDVFTIGRLPECDLYLPFGGVSRCHARLLKTAADMWSIEDMGSKNGTQLNDRLVTSPQQVRHGDIIWLGDVSVVVLLGEPVETVIPKQVDTAEQKTIFHNVKQLQEQWIQADSHNGDISNKVDTPRSKETGILISS